MKRPARAALSTGAVLHGIQLIWKTILAESVHGDKQQDSNKDTLYTEAHGGRYEFVANA